MLRSATEPAARPLIEGAELAPGLRVLEHLSRNRALDVYDVWDAGRYCRCVAKTVRPDRRGEARVVERLRQEGALLARLTHPHIVRAYETLEEPQTVVVLETLSGQTLDHLIGAGLRRMPVEQLALLGLQLGSAVRHLHRAGYLHLDIKPSNAIVEQGVAKLLDLSLARPPGAGTVGVGTPRYLSPEQARGEELTPAADVWGLGITLFDAATRALPFPELDGVDYPQAWLRAVPIRALRPHLPPGMAVTIDACLRPEPSQRASVDELLAALEAFA